MEDKIEMFESFISNFNLDNQDLIEGKEAYFSIALWNERQRIFDSINVAGAWQRLVLARNPEALLLCEALNASIETKEVGQELILTEENCQNYNIDPASNISIGDKVAIYLPGIKKRLNKKERENPFISKFFAKPWVH